MQQLICTSTALNPEQAPKTSINDPILLTESKCLPVEKTGWTETSFSVPTLPTDLKTDISKLEKKVTFARLLNKVSAEMNSVSEEKKYHPAITKALSTPVSPALDRRTFENDCNSQGGDSLSSSEIAITGSGFNSLLDIPSNSKRPSRLSYKDTKNPSADSILNMFRTFTSSSFLSKGNTSSTTTTPQTPIDDRFVSDESSGVGTPMSTTSAPGESPSTRKMFGTTIEIPVMDALTAQKTASGLSGSNLLQPPSILLEIPSGGINNLLSPIRELPTPMPSPALTPIMPRAGHTQVRTPVVESSDEDVKSSKGEDLSEDWSEMFIQVHRENNDDDFMSATDEDFFNQDFSPTITDHKSDFSVPPTTKQRNMVIPLLTVQEPSPPSTSPPCSFYGSPPPQKAPKPFIFPPVGSRLVKDSDKSNSLDLPFPPPVITITCNTSEPESDTEPTSCGLKNQNLEPHNPTVNSVGMSYLSPFSICSRADRTASESNLSSSGYSSMASPGPSRCDSNNPLCLSEVEDHHPSQSQPPSRRPSPHLRTPISENRQSDESKQRGRSDSETFSDDPLMESNDEGIGTDHLDEKNEDKDTKCSRDFEVFTEKEAGGQQNTLDFGSLIMPNSATRGTLKKWDNVDSINSLGPPLAKASLQLPTIVVQSDYCDKLLSPVSSRSESPLSDKALGISRFSTMLYSKGKNDQLLFTDSDGLYDFSSSDCPPLNNKCVQAGTTHRKSTGRRRERRSSYRAANTHTKTISPVKDQTNFKKVTKDSIGHRTIAQRKPSPKRRIRTQQPISSSSSTESLTSGKSVQGLRSQDLENRKGKVNEGITPASNEASAEDTAEVRTS